MIFITIYLITANRKAKSELLWLLFCCVVTPNLVFSQTIEQRFFMDMSALVNAPASERSPASISLAAEPKIWLYNHIYAGLKIDLPLGSFGENRENGFGLQQVEPKMGAVRSVILSGYVEQHFCYSRFFFGFGIGRFSTNNIYGYNLNGNSNAVRLNPSWGRMLTVGARGDDLYLSLSFKKPFPNSSPTEVPAFTSASVGLEFGNGKYLTKFKNTNDYQLPPLMLEIGQQLAAPVGKSPAAVCKAVYAEFKISFKQRFSIGARLLDIPTKGYGTDAEGYPAELQTQVSGVGRENFGRINSMKLVKSNMLFFDCYFPRKSGWLSMGLGGGWYRFEGLEMLQLDGSSEIPGIQSASNAGILLRLGHKVGFFRSGLDLNLIGKGVPSFASFHVGIEPGFFIYRDKGAEN
ncbi:MAG: hypothetical protein GC192_17195 [Bacteroidetes bacterium]|nr:hypothetical protein [Bacteroidota bacterium]